MSETRFCPERFRAYAQDLSKAVLDLSRERMGATSDLRQRFGLDNIRVRFGENRQFITMTDDNGKERTVEVNVSASDDEIARALNLQKINELTSKPMPTIAEQLKAARAQHIEARQAAVAAVAESADASRVVLQEIEKVRKEAAELRAEVAELTNGAPL